MKCAILAVCVAAVVAKPHVYLFNGPAPLNREGRLIETPEVAHARATHLAAVNSAFASALSSSSSSSSKNGYSRLVQRYQGPLAPLSGDGHVVDTAEVAQLKAERLAALNKARAEAQASAAAERKLQNVPTFIVQADHHGYSSYSAPINANSHSIKTNKVANLKAGHLTTFAEEQAKVAAFATTSALSSSAEGYSYDAPTIQLNHPYNGIAAPVGQDGRVVDTDEVAKLKAEHIATLEKAYAEAAANSAESSSSFEGYSYEAPVQNSQPSTVYGAPTVPAQPQQIYNGPPAPVGQDGRVVDTDEVARVKAEHLATLEKANAEAAFNAANSNSFEGYSYEAPAQTTIPAPTYGAPSVEVQPQQTYNGPFATIGQDGHVVDTDEVAKLKAEHIATLEKAHAEAAVSSAESSSSFEGYSYEAPVHNNEPTTVYGAPTIPAQPQPIYSGPPAPLGQDGRVIDTDEVARLKAEHLATLEKANAEAALNAANSNSFEGYSYEAPAQTTIPAPTYGAPSAEVQPQQTYNGPFATIGQDGHVVDTDEVAKLKAEHIATLEKAHAEAAVSSAESSSSFEGYSYEAPTQNNEPATVYGAPTIPAQPQPIYSGPPAPLGPDGRVIDTDEVARLKAEHLATLEKANAEAALNAANSNSFEGYSYEAPSQDTIPVQSYGAPEKVEHSTTSEKAHTGAAVSSAESSSSFEGYSYEAPVQNIQPITVYGEPVIPAQPQQLYNGPPAPLGQDGRVIDTDEVAKLKAEHLATLAKANAEAAAIEAMEAAMRESSSEGYNYEAPAAQFDAIPVRTYGEPAAEPQLTSLNTEHIATSENAYAVATASAAESSSSSEGYHYDAPIAQPQIIYNGPFATIGEDGRVVDTDEVAKLKAQHLATLAKANAEAAAIEAMEAALDQSSADGYHDEAPAVKFETIPAPTYSAPAAQPQNFYNGPPAPLGQDGRVIDTDEVARLKAEHIATLEQANAAAAASSAESISNSAEGYTYEAPIQQIQPNPAPTYGAPVSPPQNLYNGPPAPLGQDGRVIDTDEVARLKAEHIATLEKANAAAAAVSSAESSSNSAEGYTDKTPIQKFEPIPVPTYDTAVAQPQNLYDGPPAPLGQDGRVIDTDEVARLKAEHIATLEKANAAAAASEAASSSSSSEQGYSYKAPVSKMYLPAPAFPAVTYGAPISNIQQTYGGPVAHLSQDNQASITQEVAQLKSEHTATLTRTNAEAKTSAASASSFSSTSSSVGVTYSAPAVQRSGIIQRYSGPFAPLAADGTVLDTDEVARLKADHLAALRKATAEAIVNATAEVNEGYYSPPLPQREPYRRTFRSY